MAPSQPIPVPYPDLAPLAAATGRAIVSPRDAASGLATGKRMHKPLVFARELG